MAEERSFVKFLRDAALTILGGIVIEPTLKLISFDVGPYLRQIWFGILVFVTFDFLWRSKRIRKWAPSFYASLTPRRRAMSFVLVALLGAGTFSLYWLGVTKVLARKSELPESPQRVVLRTYVQPVRLLLLFGSVPQPSVTVFYKNVGLAPADVKVIATRISYTSDVEQEEIDRLFNQFSKDFEQLEKQHYVSRAPSLDPSETRPAEFRIRDKIEMEKLLSGEKYLQVVGGISFSDATGNYRKGFCYMWASPNIQAFAIPGEHPLTHNMMENWLGCKLSKLAEWEANARN
jgi:hypothetical protein